MGISMLTHSLLTKVGIALRPPKKLKRKKRRAQRVSPFIVFLIIISMFIGGLCFYFFEHYRLRSPIILQVPWESKIISPVPESTEVKVIRLESDLIPLEAVTATPTPKAPKRALHVIPEVQAEEVAYEYQSLNLDEGQKANMVKVEAVLGNAGAQLVFKESGFHNTSVNSSSGACGLFQAMPCEKMGCSLEDVSCQIAWGQSYIERRYGSAENALSFHRSHGWY